MPCSNSSGRVAVSRPGDGLSRDEKRNLGSWAGPAHGMLGGPRPKCCRCKEQAATVRMGSLVGGFLWHQARGTQRALSGSRLMHARTHITPGSLTLGHKPP